MALLNISIPDDLKEAFDETFSGCNRSAVIAELMRDAIDTERRFRAGVKAIDALLMKRAAPASREDGGAERPVRRRKR